MLRRLDYVQVDAKKADFFTVKRKLNELMLTIALWAYNNFMTYNNFMMCRQYLDTDNNARFSIFYSIELLCDDFLILLVLQLCQIKFLIQFLLALGCET